MSNEKRNNFFFTEFIAHFGTLALHPDALKGP
jgi:hypothetical protein